MVVWSQRGGLAILWWAPPKTNTFFHGAPYLVKNLMRIKFLYKHYFLNAPHRERPKKENIYHGVLYGSKT